MKHTKLSMYKLNYSLTAILAAISCMTLALTSCSKTYTVEGQSSITALDGSKLYLKTIEDNELKKIDSCEVIHGKFEFNGNLDTIRIATLYMDDESIMPVVLEDGAIKVNIDNTGRRVSGTPMNEVLYEFLDKINQLNNKRNELSHQHTQMLLDGMPEHDANQAIAIEAAKISEEEDKLVMKYITENFDNVVGPGIFMMLTSGFPYPVLTPQIEHIMSRSTEKFKNDPYVKDYYRTAQENETKLQGLAPESIDEQSADSIPSAK